MLRVDEGLTLRGCKNLLENTHLTYYFTVKGKSLQQKIGRLSTPQMLTVMCKVMILD